MATATGTTIHENDQALSLEFHALYDLVGTMNTHQLQLYARLLIANQGISHAELHQLYLRAEAATRRVEEETMGGSSKEVWEKIKSGVRNARTLFTRE